MRGYEHQRRCYRLAPLWRRFATAKPKTTKTTKAAALLEHFTNCRAPEGLSDLDYVETESSRKRSNSTLNLQDLDHDAATGAPALRDQPSASAHVPQSERPAKRAKQTRFSDQGALMTKAEFLTEAEPLTFELLCQPKALGSGFGWSKAGGRTRVPLRPGSSRSLQCSGPTLNVNVLGSKGGDCGLSLDQFLREAEAQTFAVECSPYEFSTGSLGWMGHTKEEVHVAGKRLRLQINLNCPVVGSKETPHGPQFPTSTKARAAVKRIDWKVIHSLIYYHSGGRRACFTPVDAPALLCESSSPPPTLR